MTGPGASARAPDGETLRDRGVETLKGVGPSLRAKLERLGIFTLGDLLAHLPIRYQDRSRLVPLNELRSDGECLVEGEVVDSKIGFGRRRSWTVTLTDGRGFLTLRFFHFSRRQQALVAPGLRIRAFGDVRFGPAGLEMAHPEYHVFEHDPPALAHGLTPVYRTTRGLSQQRLRSLVSQVRALDWPDEPGTPFRDLLYLHEPPADASADDIAACQERLAADELTAYYLVMRHRQRDRARQTTLALPQAHQLGRTLLRNLGFELTGAQKRVVREVLEDLAAQSPMLRLVQGDVGSGKTVVAAFAAIRAAEHGAQTALMAPTEILAEQHYLKFSAWLEPLGIPVVLLTGSLTAAARREAAERLSSGSALVAVGTHALFQSGVDFARLALTIIDEQHRFGVHQRMALRNKGRTPHQLVMTATPIPRTLTMALYADMAVSVIDELPPGRQPIETRVVSAARRGEVLDTVRQVLARGGQAYWVCPLIEPSEQLDLAAAEPTADDLHRALPGSNIGLLHGRLPGSEKARVMETFAAGRLGLLVATTVIEVGVDVPNATLMVIENPERMGLAQLHQLRGRVGRGDAPSHCILLYKGPLSETARARLKAIRQSQDGFYLAEQDLALRGAGELLGTRQTGEQGFRIADLSRHAHLMTAVVARGDRLLADAPEEARALLHAWAPADTGHISV
ncbi:MAG: ATP-dependent DNA helicase RecG [Gammaproteobacteria bacterium]|nr:ATP-dependent DNA helicase RecG [Gammaproteobacteria bacterium]